MMNNFLNSKNLKIFSTISYFLVILSLLIINKASTDVGYEISIYNAYPWYLWIILSFIFLLSTFLSLQMFFQNQELNKSKFFYIWGPSFLSIFILMILPYLRGYIIYGRGDTLSHIGYINYILTFFNVGNNGYPLLHILTVNLHYLTGISVYPLVMLLPAIFIIFYMIWMLILGKTIFKKEYLLYLMVIFVFILKFERIEQFAPFNMSLFVIPLFFYLLYQKKRVPNSILMIIILFTVTFFHIFVAATLVILTVVYLISEIIWAKLPSKLNFRRISVKFKSLISNNDIFRSNDLISNINTNTLILAFTILVSWAVTMYLTPIGSIFSWFLYTGGGENVLSSNLNVLNSANLNLYELIYTIWAKYSVFLFFYTFPIIITSILIYKRTMLKFEKRTFQIALIFLSFILVTLLFAFAKDFFSYDRVVRIIVVSSTILITLLIYQLKEKILNKKSLFIVLYLILSIMIITSLFTLHKSPITIEPNNQVTESELTASIWFTNYASYEKIYFVYNNEDITRYLDATIYRYIELSPAYYYYKMGVNIPTKFGYENYTTIADTFNTSNRYPYTTYMIFSKIDTDYHLVFFKRLWDKTKTYDSGSIAKLNNDSTADIVYDNGETQNWLIK